MLFSTNSLKCAADDFERLVVATMTVFCKLIGTTYCVIHSCLNELDSITFLGSIDIQDYSILVSLYLILN